MWLPTQLKITKIFSWVTMSSNYFEHFHISPNGCLWYQICHKRLSQPSRNIEWQTKHSLGFLITSYTKIVLSPCNNLIRLHFTLHVKDVPNGIPISVCMPLWWHNLALSMHCTTQGAYRYGTSVYICMSRAMKYCASQNDTLKQESLCNFL